MQNDELWWEQEDRDTEWQKVIMEEQQLSEEEAADAAKKQWQAFEKAFNAIIAKGAS